MDAAIFVLHDKYYHEWTKIAYERVHTCIGIDLNGLETTLPCPCFVFTRWFVDSNGDAYEYHRCQHIHDYCYQYL